MCARVREGVLCVLYACAVCGVYEVLEHVRMRAYICVFVCVAFMFVCVTFLPNGLFLYVSSIKVLKIATINSNICYKITLKIMFQYTVILVFILKVLNFIFYHIVG